jgi:uncharacterized membrane protein YkvA (DUF1232 family)
MRIVYLVLRDPRAPWYCKGAAACAAGYALSPITLIPDWIPVVGFLDNLLVLGFGIWLVEKLAPAHLVLNCRKRADAHMTESNRSSRRAAGVALATVVTGKVVVALVFTGALVALARHM